MNKIKLLKGACLVAATSMLPLSQAAIADVSISGWINEGITYFDDGANTDAVQLSDNGTTLGSRITLAGESEVAAGLTAGFEVILEPSTTAHLLGFGSTFGTVGTGAGALGAEADSTNGHSIGVLGNSLHVGGAWGKVTMGLQSMPTDNIAVLEDPSLTLWADISPVFRGNSIPIQGLGAGAVNTTFGSFLQCLTVPGLPIGIDCNGIYRSGVRYDLPAFGPVTVAVGAANDDIFDVAVKYKGSFGRISTSVAGGYAVNPDGGSNAGGFYAENIQVQAGIMDAVTGLFGSVAYQMEETDLPVGSLASDDTDAFWFKAGIKKQWLSVGNTAITADYGMYNDQFGAGHLDVTGSEVERFGVGVNQYFGSSLIIYGKYEILDLEVDGGALSSAAYGGAEELETFTLGGVYFF